MVRPRLAVLAVTLALAVRVDDISSQASELTPFQEVVLALSSIAWLVPDSEMIVLAETKDNDTLYTVKVVRESNPNWKLSDMQPRKFLAHILAAAGSSALQASEVDHGNSTFWPSGLPSGTEAGMARPPAPRSTLPVKRPDGQRPVVDSHGLPVIPHSHFQPVDPGLLPFNMIMEASLSGYLNALLANTDDEPQIKAEKFIGFTAEIYKSFGGDGGRIYSVAERLYNGDSAGATVTAVVIGLAQLIQHHLLDLAVVEAVAQVLVHEAEREMFTKGLDALSKSKELSEVDALKDTTKLSRMAVRKFQKQTQDEEKKEQQASKKRRDTILQIVRTKLRVAMGMLNIWKIAKAVVAEGGLGELADGFQDLLSGDQHPWQHMANDMLLHAKQAKNDMTQHAVDVSQHFPHLW